jgi:hypothetical protein
MGLSGDVSSTMKPVSSTMMPVSPESAFQQYKNRQHRTSGSEKTHWRNGRLSFLDGEPGDGIPPVYILLSSLLCPLLPRAPPPPPASAFPCLLLSSYPRFISCLLYFFLPSSVPSANRARQHPG